jgi:tetratricopeptide (TPR) repeat protein
MRVFFVVSTLVMSAALACSERAEPSLDDVLELHAEENFGASIPLLERMIDAKPGDRQLNRLYGIALLSTGQPVPAIWPLEKATDGPNAPLEDLLLLGRAHLTGGNPTDARAVADRMIERAPDLLEARNLRIEANLAVLGHVDALADIDFILEHRPDDPGALVNRAHVLLLLEQTEDAEAAIAEAREALASTGSTGDWAARFCALDATFTFEKGDEGHVERSAERWRSCLENHPADPLVVSSAIDFFDAQQEDQTSMDALRRAVKEAPENVDFHIRLASRLAAAGFHGEAINELRVATEQPGGLRAWGSLVDYYSARGEWPDARAAMEKLLELIPHPSQRELVHYADLLIRAGDLDAAEEAMKKVNQPELSALLEGRLLLARGQPKQALARLEEGIRLWPDNSVARQLLAEAWEKLGNYEKALAEYVEAARVDPSNWEVMERLALYYEPMKKSQPLTQLLQRLTLREPNDPRPYRMLVNAFVWSGQPRLANSALAKLAGMPEQREWVVAKRATLVGRDKPEAAIRLIEESGLDLTTPRSAEVLTPYVEHLARVGRHADALEVVRSALTAHEDFAPFHEVHAKVLAAASRPAVEVTQALERAIEIAPGRASALTALADQARESNRVEDALALYDRAIAAAPSNPAPAWAAIELLVSREEKSNTLDARVDQRLERLLASHGHHAGAAELMARRLVSKGESLERARALAQRSVFLGGGATALATLGWVDLERGKPETAIRFLRRSLATNPHVATTHFQLGRALARSGDTDGAREALESALAIGGFRREAEARAELARLGS